MNKQLGIYARQSREKETNGSIEDQIFHGETQARDLKIPYKIYEDKGESAAYDNFDNRPAFKQLLADIQNNVISEVFVIDLSRLTRNEETNLLIKKIFKQKKIKIYTLLDGIVDYEDENSVFINDIKNLMSVRFIQHTSTKIKSVLKKNVINGKALTGFVQPYGYLKDEKGFLAIDQEEEKVIENIFNMANNGIGSSRIAQYLNKAGIPTKATKFELIKLETLNSMGEPHNFTPKNYQWAQNTVLGILKNPIYKGCRIHKGETFDAPQIIDAEIWDIVQINIGKNRHKPGLSKHNYLLNNISFCGRCGSNFCGRTRVSKRDNIYYCSSRVKTINRCGIRSININTLESIIWAMISSSEILLEYAKKEVENLKNPEYLLKLNEEKKALEELIKKETSTKLNILALLNKNLLTMEEAESQMEINKININNYSNSLNDINIKLNADLLISKKIDDAEEFVKQWDKLVFTDNFDLKLQIVRMFIEKITINFDDDTELYKIEVKAKIPTVNEISTFYIEKSGDLSFDKITCKILNKNNLRPSLKLDKKEKIQEKKKYKWMPSKVIEQPT